MTRKINENPLNIKWNVMENKWTFPDYSGKYYGKLSDKKNSNDEKISKKCNRRKKDSTEKLSEIKRET